MTSAGTTRSCVRDLPRLCRSPLELSRQTAVARCVAVPASGGGQSMSSSGSPPVNL